MEPTRKLKRAEMRLVALRAYADSQIKKYPAYHPADTTTWRDFALNSYCPIAKPPIFGSSDFGGKPGGEVRWCEDFRGYFRFCGYADDIDKYLHHNGWYCDPWQHEVYRGIVLQTVSRNGRPNYLHGYEDPWNPGGALICLHDADDDPESAARAADKFARTHAETDKDLYIKEDTEERIKETREKIKKIRGEIITLCHEIRVKCTDLSGSTVLRGALKLALKTLIEKKRTKERDIIRWEKNPEAYYY